MLAISDIHLGVQRKAGTTMQSQELMRSYLFGSFRNLLETTTEIRLLIQGDLFDEYEVAPRDWIDTYTILSAWLVKGNSLILVAGNHDDSPKANRVSSFKVLCDVLKSQFPLLVTVVGVNGLSHECGGSTYVAHCANQDLFNTVLEQALSLTQSGQHVFVHANYDNNFAIEIDHSLNVSVEQAEEFKLKGAFLVFAHEHQSRTALGGHVIVLGNQWPTSVADCKGNDSKFAHVLSGSFLTKVETWSADGVNGFKEVDWRDLLALETEASFIRVPGEASRSEAADVVNTIAKFRLRSPCFVITNAVKVDGVIQAEELPEAFEAARQFDVMEFIAKHLDPEELVVVKGLAQEE